MRQCSSTSNDYATAPAALAVTVWRSVHASPLPVYHGYGGQMREGERSRLGQSNAG